jgi:cullin 3
LAETQVPGKDLKRALQSLAMGKSAQRILSRKGHGKDIGLFVFFLLILLLLFALLDLCACAANVLPAHFSIIFAENSDEFFVNEGFSSKLHRVKIQMVSGRGESEPECKETRSKVR